MTIKDAITKVLAFCTEDLGLEVVYDDDWGYHGSIDYQNNRMTLNISHGDDKITLMTLAHELGHYGHYEEMGHEDAPAPVIREAYAMTYGWGLLETNGLDGFITPSEWVEFHDEMHLYFLNEYESKGQS